MAEAPAQDLSLEQLVEELAREHGPDLRGYKHTSLERRIRRRMQQVGIGTFSDYLEKVRREDGNEAQELLSSVLINVTEFFRDPQSWEFLREEVLPPVLGRLKPGDPFRAWSAGCATGEEPFSLAITLAELLGRRAQEYDIKIYATDIDDDALNVARRGEYPADRLQRVPPAIREKYFKGSSSVMRIDREVRRMVIFGRGNIASDAPISHCQVVLCRNVLIYFDAKTQQQVLGRFHYALQPHGILFLGKAESKLSGSRSFRPLHPRWRIFERLPQDSVAVARSEAPVVDDADDKLQQEYQRLRLYQRHILEAIHPGVLTLDNEDIIVSHNEAALGIWRLSEKRVQGRRLQNTELVLRCPELLQHLEATRNEPKAVFFQCSLRSDGEDRAIHVSLRPVVSEAGQREGTVVYVEDISDREKLQTTVEQLEATSEELQSSNEELETTNEELQSTNEELETTNEELQSTNEELETTNEELQSLNEELENMNEELEHRTQELNEVNRRYAETLQSMPWPVLLVDRHERIQLWNSAAQRLFGVGDTSVIGVSLDALPMESAARGNLLRRVRSVLEKNRPTTLRQLQFPNGTFDLHFTPLSRDGKVIDGALIMFGGFPLANGGGDGAAGARRTERKSTAAVRAKKKKR